MMTQVPARGKRAKILALAKKSVDPAAIAAELQTSVGAVRTIISSLRGRGHDIPYRRQGRRGSLTLSLVISRDLSKTLNTAALTRKVSPRDLAIMLLTITLRDRMVDAILDDAPKTKERKS